MKKFKRYFSLLLLACLCVYGVYDVYAQVENVNKTNAYDAYYQTLDLNVDKLTFEYNDVITEELFADDDRIVNITHNIQNGILGTYYIDYKLSGVEEKYNLLVERYVRQEVEIVDKTAPVITLNKDTVNINVNSDYDVHENIASINDEIDGDIAEGDGTNYNYVITTDLDTTTTGSYNVNIKAYDKNGNMAESNFTVNVNNVKTYSVSYVSVDTSGNYSAIMSYLMNDMGLNKAASCGILANMYYESKFNPTAGSTYYGLIQWGGGRKSNLFNYCANNGLGADSLEGQLAFLNYELNSSYSSVLSSLYAVSDDEAGAMEAANIVMRSYEGTSGSGRDTLAASYYVS